MLYHHEKTDAVLKHLASDMSHGLSDQQIKSLQEKYGANKLREKKKKTNLQRVLDQFKDVMILILIAAAVVSFVIACVVTWLFSEMMLAVP